MALEDPPTRHRGLFTAALRAPYFFEWLAMLSAGALWLFLATQPVWSSPFALARQALRMIVTMSAFTVFAMLILKVPRLIRAGRGWRVELTRTELAGSRFWWDTVRIVAAFCIIQTSHLMLKLYVPVVNSANHDALLGRVDRILFLGHDPGQLMLSALSSPLAHRLTDVAYTAVYGVALWGGVVVFFAFLRGRQRIAFFNSFFLMWQLGLLLYVMLPAWGPVFINPETYREALIDMPVTYAVQSGLYRETSSIVRGDYDVAVRYFGIAAFPSIHVAVFVLYSLWATRLNRWWLAWNLCLIPVILAGSLLTGYHYLVDGVAGALVAAFAWVIGRRMVMADGGDTVARCSGTLGPS